MRYLIPWLAAAAAVIALGFNGSAAAQAPAPPAKKEAMSAKEREHRQADIARHRQMAAAHEAAARCLDAGTPEKQCQLQLREACKGIAVGQYCGMRHAH